jgi:hypothetical protein
VRIERVLQAQGYPPPAIETFSILGGHKLYELFEVFVTSEVCFSRVADLAGHSCLLNA